MAADAQTTRPLGYGLGAKPWGPALILVLFGLAVYLPGLGSVTGITQKDEFNLTVRTQIETLNRGAFWTPRLNGRPRLRKPPLLYWVLVLTGRVTGPNLFLARLPVVAAALLLAWACAALAAECGVREDTRKLWAGLGLLTTAGAYAMGRMALLDVPVAAFAAVAILLFLRWTRTESWGSLLLCGLFAGLAWMVKGPIGPYVVAVAAAARLTVFGGWGRLWRRRGQALAGLGLFLLVAAPWPVSMWLKWGGLVADALESDTSRFAFGRVLLSPFKTAVNVFALTMPWGLLLLASLVNAWRRRRDGEGREDLWLLLWIALAAAPFFFAAGSHERYVTPALPAAVVLMARRFDRNAWEGKVALWITAAGIAVVAATLTFGGLWFRVGGWGLWVAYLAVSLGAAWVLGQRRELLSGAALTGLGMMLLGGVLYPCLGVNRLPPDIAKRLSGTPRVYKYLSTRPAFLSLALGKSVMTIGHHAKLADAAGSAVVVSGETRRRFKKELGPLGLAAGKPLCHWRAFGTRKTFLNFARKGAIGEDWRKAFRDRSLDGLREEYRALPVRRVGRGMRKIGVGTAHWFAPPLPPNRTCGSPASGSPVGGYPRAD